MKNVIKSAIVAVVASTTFASAEVNPIEVLSYNLAQIQERAAQIQSAYATKSEKHEDTIFQLESSNESYSDIVDELYEVRDELRAENDVLSDRNEAMKVRENELLHTISDVRNELTAERRANDDAVQYARIEGVNSAWEEAEALMAVQADEAAQAAKEAAAVSAATIADLQNTIANLQEEAASANALAAETIETLNTLLDTIEG